MIRQGSFCSHAVLCNRSTVPGENSLSPDWGHTLAGTCSMITHLPSSSIVEVISCSISSALHRSQIIRRSPGPKIQPTSRVWFIYSDHSDKVSCSMAVMDMQRPPRFRITQNQTARSVPVIRIIFYDFALATVCRNSSKEMRRRMLWSTACWVNANLPCETFPRMASITNYIPALGEIFWSTPFSCQ